MRVHIHPIMIQIHPQFSNQAAMRFLSEWRSSVQTTHNSWLTLAFYLRPALSDLRAVRPSVNSGAGEDKMSPIKRLRRFVVGYNNEYSSRHLLLTSELLKMQRINVTFVLKGMHRSQICLNASVHANHSWSIVTSRRSEYVFLWIFANRFL